MVYKFSSGVHFEDHQAADQAQKWSPSLIITMCVKSMKVVGTVQYDVL